MFVRHARAAVVLLTCTLGCSFAILPSSAFAEPSARHCVAQPSGTPGQPPAMQCFSTFAAAISAATNPAGPLTSVILSIDYTGTNESGSSLTWTKPAGCGSYTASSMPTGWNDVVSSVSNFNGCGTTLYQNTSFSGSTFSIAVDGTANTLGSFNRQASSQKWCTSNGC
jgi:hypothetical protein